MQIRVYYEDTDCGGVVYHTNYLKFCERDRSEKFFQKGIVFDNDSYFIVSKLEADFKKPAKLGDILKINTKISSLKKASIVLDQQIFKNDILIFQANVTLVYMQNNKISKIPQGMIDILSK